MSKIPVDVVSFTDEFRSELADAIVIANGIQNEFLFSATQKGVTDLFRLLVFEKIHVDEFLDAALGIRNGIKGYYPYIIFFCDSPLNSDDWSNLYGSTSMEGGLAIITTDCVPDTIIPKDRMVSFFVYYLTRTLLKFILKDKFNHDEPSKNGCLFDFMENKRDLLKSMRADAICDDCKRDILQRDDALSTDQLHAIDTLLTKSGTLLTVAQDDVSGKRRIFIGSSTEGLQVARKIKSGLRYDAHVDTWADGIFDRPGKAYIEVLEGVLQSYEFGIFVFTPDDRVFSRGQVTDMPRDNVIFEYGMFLGRHSRHRAFFIVPRGVDVKIMSDLLGITSLDYDPTNPNIASAVGDACEQIRDVIATTGT